MARKTRAELMAEREAALVAERERDEAEYPARMMLAMDRATNSFNFELTVVENQFVLTDRNSEYEWQREFELSYSWDADSQSVLESLESVLEEKAEKCAQAARRAEMRSQALNKLTAEERELLGL